MQITKLLCIGLTCVGLISNALSQEDKQGPSVDDNQSELQKLIVESVGLPFKVGGSPALTAKESSIKLLLKDEKSRASLKAFAIQLHRDAFAGRESVKAFSARATKDDIVAAEPATLPPVDSNDERVLTRLAVFDYGKGIGSEIIAQVAGVDDFKPVSSREVPSSAVPATEEEKAIARELLASIPAYKELFGFDENLYSLGFFISDVYDPNSEQFGHRVFAVRPVVHGDEIRASGLHVPMVVINMSIGEIVETR